MVKVLAVCGNGMGTSLIIKMKVAKFLKENGVDAKVDSCAVGDANGMLRDVNIVLCSKHLVQQLRTRDEQTVIGLKNLLDANEYGQQLLEACAARS